MAPSMMCCALPYQSLIKKMPYRFFHLQLNLMEVFSQLRHPFLVLFSLGQVNLKLASTRALPAHVFGHNLVSAVYRSHKRVSDSLALYLQPVVNDQVDAGNQTQVLWQGCQCSSSVNHFCSPLEIQTPWCRGPKAARYMRNRVSMSAEHRTRARLVNKNPVG